MHDAAEDFAAALRDCGVLTPDQLGDLAGVAAACPDGRALAREVVARGWLTPFQAREVWQGRGGELTLGAYRLLDCVGEGGMGVVYRAVHLKLGREAAVKVIRPERLANPDAVRRFRREVRAVAALDHPNIVRGFDADEAGGRCYSAMELLDGTDLHRLVCERGPLPAHEACRHVRQAALGLQHAFERGLVHRDVKPNNLLLTAGGVVKVMDLGLARLGGGASESQITEYGHVIGTPDYMAPEQARDARAADVRADLYGLGGTLFFLLAGRPPFPAPTPMDVIVRHATEPPPDLSAARPDAPPELAAVVARLMAKRPEDRYQSPGEAAAALEPFCEPVPPVFDFGVEPSAVTTALRRPPGRGGWWLGAAVTAAVASLVAVLALKR